MRIDTDVEILFGVFLVAYVVVFCILVAGVPVE